MQTKLARQASILFSDALQQLKACTIVPRDAIEICEAKQNYYEAVAQNAAALDAKERSEWGESIARFKKALDCAKKAKQISKKLKSSGIDTFSNRLIASAEKQCAEAEKDNNWIYHAKVPAT